MLKLAISLKDYIHSAISELKKVTWPTKKQITVFTIAVIAMSIGMAVFFAILDYIFNLGLETII
ncbi:MAG: preprotein translocase subunit SecE [Candidatus Magasanikbacteria bacterium]|nr:preprotein translocase subunit SecE [Candidatus Magasanikbacteria bacterium]